MDWTPLIAAVAPNGATKTKADHSALPLTPEELARAAVQCLEAGASMMHLHVRGVDGGHTLNPDIYRQAIASIRRAVGDKLVIQATSESGGLYSPDEQMQAVRELKPEAVSLALRELIRGDTGERAVADFFHWLPRNGCVPQYILYTPEEVDRYRALLERDVIPDSPHWVLFVLGRYTGGRQSQAADLVPFSSRTVSLEHVRVRRRGTCLRHGGHESRRPCPGGVREQRPPQGRIDRERQRGPGPASRGSGRDIEPAADGRRRRAGFFYAGRYLTKLRLIAVTQQGVHTTG